MEFANFNTCMFILYVACMRTFIKIELCTSFAILLLSIYEIIHHLPTNTKVLTMKINTYIDTYD